MTESSTPPDVRLQRLARLLSTDRTVAHEPPNVEDCGQAAVSLVLRAAADMELLLIKRAEAEWDPWSGHMALPGGRRDPNDRDLVATAVRETGEETAVDLEASGWRLGRLEPVHPAGQTLPRLMIVPYVFGVPPEITAVVNSPEVDSVMWVDLSTLRDPATLRTTTIHLPEGPTVFPCFRVGEHAVWGLTYRIVAGFLELAGGG